MPGFHFASTQSKSLTHTLKLDEINAGFDRLAEGEVVRQVVMFD